MVIVVNFFITLPSIALKGKVIKKVNHYDYDYDYDVSKILNMFCPLDKPVRQIEEIKHPNIT